MATSPTDELEERFLRMRDTLRSHDGRTYREFKASLKPRYFEAWAQIAIGYAAMAAAAVALYVFQPDSWWLGLIAAVAGAWVLGYATAFVNLYFHEAAHYNLASDRAANDRLANIFIGLQIGAAIQDYRPIHFGHHRHHGTPMDTERSYFDPLNVRFLVEACFGVRSIRTLMFRSTLDQKPDEAGKAPRGNPGKIMLLSGMVFNLAIVGICLWLHAWSLALAWAGAIVIVFPFLAALRQLLEHRDEMASDKIDYRTQPHGRINRLFGDGPLSSTLGSAGFNRHLLHHWEPQVSCTRLKDLEKFLLETPLGADLRKRQTTYPTIFARLFSF